MMDTLNRYTAVFLLGCSVHFLHKDLGTFQQSDVVAPIAPESHLGLLIIIMNDGFRFSGELIVLYLS